MPCASQIVDSASLFIEFIGEHLLHVYLLTERIEWKLMILDIRERERESINRFQFLLFVLFDDRVVTMTFFWFSFSVMRPSQEKRKPRIVCPWNFWYSNCASISHFSSIQCQWVKSLHIHCNGMLKGNGREEISFSISTSRLYLTIALHIVLHDVGVCECVPVRPHVHTIYLLGKNGKVKAIAPCQTQTTWILHQRWHWISSCQTNGLHPHHHVL